jgi:hypothetical protein
MSFDPRVVVGLLALAGWCCWQVARQHRRLRAVTGVPRSRIRSAAQGYVELHGRARVRDEACFVSPLSGEKCLYLELQRERVQGNRRNARRTTVDRAPEFVLDDDTGEAIVVTEGADFTHLGWSPWYYGWSDDPWRARRRSAFWILFQRWRFRERILPVSSVIYLLGDFSTPTARSREVQVREALLALKRDRSSLLERFDTDGDGEISLEEWERARLETEAEVGRRLLAEAAVTELPLLTRPRHRHLPFLISTETDESRLSRSIRLKLWLAWVGAAGSMVVLLSMVSLAGRAAG